MILLLDNYDSFVHNLARYFRCLGVATQVVRSDQIDVEGCRRLNPDAIVISPGPKRPEDAGCSIDVIRHFDSAVPILGVCLGHQAIGLAMGGRIIEVPPMHGIASLVTHNTEGLFAGCSNPTQVGRYHSLAIDPTSVPDCLQVTATSDDGIIMAVRHRQRPLLGVQFHPESILSEDGARLLENFANMSRCRVTNPIDLNAARLSFSRQETA
ncbi:Aminodeoxychorismate synthase component 2 [Rubripirellula amarantea]|uniref:Aminodeoxychorismate synthase component 2 n=1 Tax=Rubripirellula amarantea TaxID=2527999 RepID=A0A5C5WNS8_9BACT|nr:Aminodeoxychorismate synthase component 2 [Rubripirellula amarantea]